MKATISIAALVAVSCTPVFAELARVDFTARSAPEIDIAIREIIDRQQLRAGDPVILLHGARVPGIPSFDLDVPGGSLAADLAKAGLATYVVDLRGYGRSTRPPAMTVPPRPTEPLVRSGDAVADLGAAVDAVLARTGAHHVSILGWATGGHWAGMYAALQPEKVSKVVFYNALYGYTEHHPSLGRGSSLADPDHPGFFNVKR
jgi:pimeloyl-ACP methyl ester carboxylesterase